MSLRLRHLGMHSAACALALLAPAAASSAPALASNVDPAAYCRVVGTAGDPVHDHSYRGPATTPAMLRLFGLPGGPNDPIVSVVWRCARGRVLACATYGTTSCEKAPWMDRTRSKVNAAIEASCRETPNTECAGATHCIWACRAGRPVLNRSQYPTDAQGFSPKEWKVVR
jgi:hypothetical protein